MPLSDVVIREYEMSTGGFWIRFGKGLERSDLLGIGINVLVHTYECCPVPSGANRKYGVQRGRCLIVLSFCE